MAGPEVADARARERHERHQAGADHQPQQAPAPGAELRAGRGAQAQRVEQGREHGELAHEARQRRHAGDDQRAHEVGQAQEGCGGGNHAAHQHFLVLVEVQARGGHQLGGEEGSVVVHLVGRQRGAVVAPAVDQVGQQEKGAHRQRGAGQVVEQPGGEPVLPEARRRQQRAGGQHRRMARQVGEALRAHHADGAEGHGGHAPGDQPQVAEQRRGAGLAAEQQRPQAQQRVDAHLGHDGEQSAHGRRGGAVGGHQPEVERPHGGLDEEGRGEDGRRGVQQAAVGVRHLGHALRQVGHVERAGDAVEHRGADEEQRGGRQVDGDVVQPRLHARAPRAVQQQAVGGREHDLEEHEQVEQVRREEGTAQPHELELEQRVVVHAGAVPARAREHDGAQGHDAGQHQHQRRQAVQREHDAERRGPVAWQVHAHGGGGAGLVRPYQQGDGDQQARQRGEDVERELEALLFLAQQHHERGREHGQADGGQHQVRHQGGGELGHAAHWRTSGLRTAGRAAFGTAGRRLMASPGRRWRACRPRGRCRPCRARPAAPRGTGPSWRSR